MRVLVSLICLSVLATSSSGQVRGRKDDVAAQGDRLVQRQLFAVIYRPGKGWKPGQPMSRQDLGGHLRYYRQGLADGRVFAGGGLMAINGGLAILTMTSLPQAEAFLAADPAILNGTFSGEVHVWTPAVMSSEQLKR